MTTDSPDLRAVLEGLLRATEFSAWTRDGEEVATVPLEALDRLIVACDVARAALAAKPSDPEAGREGLREGQIADLLNRLGIVGPNIYHRLETAEDREHDIERDRDVDAAIALTDPDAEWCVCGRRWPCEAQELGQRIAELQAGLLTALRPPFAAPPSEPTSEPVGAPALDVERKSRLTLNDLRDKAEAEGVTYWDDTWTRGDFLAEFARLARLTPASEEAEP